MGSNTIPQKVYTLLSAVSGAGPTSSVSFSLRGIRKCTVFVTRASGTTGNSDVTATASADGTNYVTFNGFITNAVNANTAFTARVATINLSTNTTKMITMDMDYASPLDQVIFTLTNTSGTDDGVYTVKLVTEYY